MTTTIERTDQADEATKLPDWVNHTPNDHSYSLLMIENDEAGIQTVDLSRAEFIALKSHVASMRGYMPEGFADRFRAIAARGDYKNDYEDQHELAINIENAREIYRTWPEVIVSSAKAIDDAIGPLAEGCGSFSDAQSLII